MTAVKTTQQILITLNKIKSYKQNHTQLKQWVDEQSKNQLSSEEKQKLDSIINDLEKLNNIIVQHETKLEQTCKENNCESLLEAAKHMQEFGF